ncbi:hypothetical protein B0H13DRAFT_2373072 [Mycena leptocephala]|nr:hypothetical protein B0H13DRAFT_2373072 [Mycena leptocephala]
MVIAARCPTGAPPQLVQAFGSFKHVLEGVRVKDVDTEAEGGEAFDVIEWVSRSDGAIDKPYDIMHFRLALKVPTASDDVEMDAAITEKSAPGPKERKVGDTYSPDCLPDHRGPYFAHQDSKLVQRDYKDLDGDLIAPHELYENLTEGTLFSAQNTMHIYIFQGSPGRLRSKIYHYYSYLKQMR